MCVCVHASAYAHVYHISVYTLTHRICDLESEVVKELCGSVVKEYVDWKQGFRHYSMYW